MKYRYLISTGLVMFLSLNAFGNICYKDGDVNSDGKLTLGDAQSMWDFYFGKKIPNECEKKHADLDGDNQVSPGDIGCALAYFYGQPSCVKPSGDIDGSSIVDKTDLTIIANFLARKTILSDVQRSRADVTRDGLVDRNDNVCIALKTTSSLVYDLNMDWKITFEDAQMAYDLYLGKIDTNRYYCAKYLGDTNDDGVVTPGDAQLIFNFLNLK